MEHIPAPPRPKNNESSGTTGVNAHSETCLIARPTQRVAGHPRRDQRVAPAQRHDPVAAVRDLPGAEGVLRSRLRPDRPDHLRLPGDRVALAAGRRHRHRPAADALLAADRHGRQPCSASSCCRSRRASASCSSPPRSIGLGSSVFHPESSRVARLASGGRYGFAQSIFQVGGNIGTAIGPLLAAAIVVPHGQASIAWFSLVALVGDRRAVERRRLVQAQRTSTRRRSPPAARDRPRALSRGVIVAALAVLVALIFSKFFYLAALHAATTPST